MKTNQRGDQKKKKKNKTQNETKQNQPINLLSDFRAIRNCIGYTLCKAEAFSVSGINS